MTHFASLYVVKCRFLSHAGVCFIKQLFHNKVYTIFHTFKFKNILNLTSIFSHEMHEILDNHLIKEGAILFRKMSPILPNEPEFGDLIVNLGHAPFDYQGGVASREYVKGAQGILNASDDPPQGKPNRKYEKMIFGINIHF